MSRGDQERARRQIRAGLARYEKRNGALPGICDSAVRECFVLQVVDSMRRVEYPQQLLKRSIGVICTDPSSVNYDPLRAAIYFYRQGEIDEAFWQLFYFVHFGKSLGGGWRLARDVYSGLGPKHRWTWAKTSRDLPGFRSWMAKEHLKWKGDGVSRAFGNHRKREGYAAIPTVVESYVAWVGAKRGHVGLIGEAEKTAGPSPAAVFDHLYGSMNVHRFGRTARFDYLTMVGKLGFASLEPGVAYLKNATGPKKGARLLLGGERAANIDWPDLERRLVELAADLGVGQQVMEDSLCNWQKAPEIYMHFAG